MSFAFCIRKQKKKKKWCLNARSIFIMHHINYIVFEYLLEEDDKNGEEEEEAKKKLINNYIS